MNGEQAVVEKDWTSKAGLRCVVLALKMGHRCGYVGIEKDHPLYGHDYSKKADCLQAKSEEVMQGTIGKRGIIPLICASFDEDRKLSPEIVFDVHGGITYSSFGNPYPVESPETFWYGFDCAHFGDAKDPSIMSEKQKEIELHYPRLYNDGEIRTLEYVASECESLARQLMEITE